MDKNVNKADKLQSRPRLGFLGVGWIGYNRLQAIYQSGLAEIAAVADASAVVLESVRVKVTEFNPYAQFFTSLSELLEADVDAIVIATPSALHAEQTIAALKHGKAVFCQKPLGRTAGEVREVLEAARQANLLLGVDLSYRFTAAMQKIRSLIRTGELGRIFAVNLVFHNAYGPDKAWFNDPELAGGGCVIDLGIHLIDLALWSLDFPGVKQVSSSLTAQGEPLSKHSNKVEDYAVALINLDSGSTIQMACSWKLNAGCDCLIEVSFYGTSGGATFHNVNGSFYDFVGERLHGTIREPIVAPPDEWGGRAIIEWTLQLAEERGFNPEAEHLFHVSCVLDRIYER